MPSPRLDNAFIERPAQFMKTGINIDWTSFNPSEPFTVPLSSSCLSSAEYNPLNQKLTLEFVQDSTMYEYRNVPISLVMELIQSSSVGRFFNFNIRDNFAYSQVG